MLPCPHLRVGDEVLPCPHLRGGDQALPRPHLRVGDKVLPWPNLREEAHAPPCHLLWGRAHAPTCPPLREEAHPLTCPKLRDASPAPLLLAPPLLRALASLQTPAAGSLHRRQRQWRHRQPLLLWQQRMLRRRGKQWSGAGGSTPARQLLEACRLLVHHWHKARTQKLRLPSPALQRHTQQQQRQRQQRQQQQQQQQ